MPINQDGISPNQNHKTLDKVITGHFLPKRREDSVDMLLGILEIQYERQLEQLRQIRERFKQTRRLGSTRVNKQAAKGSCLQLIKQHLLEQLDGDGS